MIIHWMRVGFVHGVMNTDNMSILGLTIDYGPYGWLEDYNPGWTPNTTDAGTRRYCFGNQPKIAQWNLVKLANAIYPLIGTPEPLQAAVDNFGSYYQTGWKFYPSRKPIIRFSFAGLPWLTSKRVNRSTVMTWKRLHSPCWMPFMTRPA